MSARWPQRLLAFGRGDELRAQLIRGGTGVGVLKILSLPLTLLTTILLARGLGPEGFGQYAFVVALITVISIPLGPALQQLATRETAAFQHAGEEGRIRTLLHWANRKVWLGTLFLVVLVGGYAASVAQWQANDRWTLVLMGLAALPFLGLNHVRAGVLAGLRRVVVAQLPELLIRPAILLLAAAVLLGMGILSPSTALVAFVSASIVSIVVGVYLLRRVFPHSDGKTLPRPAYAKRWRRAWMPFTMLVTAGTLNVQIGILLLGWLSTDEQVAAMQVAARGAMLVALSLTVANLVIGPHITQVYQAGDRSRLQILSRQSARAALLAALPIALPLIFFGGAILTLVFGAEYAELATLPLAILSFGQLINVAFGSVGMLLTMSGFEHDTLRGQVTALVANTGIAVVLIPPFGAIGAAVAAGFGLILWNIILAVLVFRRLNIRPCPI